MTLKEIYEYTVKEIQKIDFEIKGLQGKREAYDNIQLEVLNEIKSEVQNEISD